MALGVLGDNVKIQKMYNLHQIINKYMNKVPIFSYFLCKIPIFGLSKERPILGDHPKVHIHEIRRISYGFHLLKSAGFRADFERPIARNGKPYVFPIFWHREFLFSYFLTIPIT